MGYQIQYNPEKSGRFPIRQVSAGKRWLIGTLISVGLLFGLAVWRDGAVLKRLLLPGDPEVTEAAFSAMVDDIRAGETVGDAVTAFCLEILENAQTGE